MNILLAAALDYASRGWPVLPLKPQLKVPATAHGLHDATTDADQITWWWTEQPRYNVGLRTGVAFDVLDLDSVESFDELDAASLETTGVHNPPIDGPLVLTGRGAHIYLLPTGRGNAAGIRKGIDWRGVGGYVVAPPSVHPNGRIYEWGLAYPIDTKLHDAPQWLLSLWGQPTTTAPPQAAPRPPSGSLSDLDGKQAYGRRALEGELGRLATAPEGERNDALVRAAFRVGQLAAGGCVNPGDAAQQLLTVALGIGLGQSEAEKTILSGMDAGKREPREPRST